MSDGSGMPELEFESGIAAKKGPKSMENITLRMRGNNTVKSGDSLTGCFFCKMPDGAKIKNCKFYISEIGSSAQAGIFYEGKNVTIGGTEVYIDSENTGDFCRIAHTLSGTITNTYVKIGVKGKELCGLADEFSGTIDGLNVDMDMTANGSALFAARGFDIENIWQLTENKKHIILRNEQDRGYDYPFPNPYPTQTGKFIFNENEPIAVMGAVSACATKISWRNLSPEEGVVSSGTTSYIIKDDSFYLEFKIALIEKGIYSVEIVSVIDETAFLNQIKIEVD